MKLAATVLEWQELRAARLERQRIARKKTELKGAVVRKSLRFQMPRMTKQEKIRVNSRVEITPEMEDELDAGIKDILETEKDRTE